MLTQRTPSRSPGRRPRLKSTRSPGCEQPGAGARGRACGLYSRVLPLEMPLVGPQRGRLPTGTLPRDPPPPPAAHPLSPAPEILAVVSTFGCGSLGVAGCLQFGGLGERWTRLQR